jgi:ABC-type sugar transport system ATPase subunit
LTLLNITHLAKSYGGAPALKDASLSIAPGEVVALMGENGAGKSTLIKILAGAVPADGGEITLEGAPLDVASPVDAHRRGLRFIHQELNIVPQLSVAENIFLGRPYPTRWGGVIDWPDLRRRARVALDALGVAEISERAIMARLHAGDRMLVKIAATFLEEASSSARLFVMDEPTASLTGAESEKLFRIVRALQRRGCGILYVSHRIDEVLDLADRIVVLRDGQTRANLDAAKATRGGLIELMTGRAIVETPAAPARDPARPIALSVSHLGGGDIEDVSFELREGEILGFAGLADSGQDQLLRALMGGATRGEIAIGGRPARIANPAQAWKQGLAYVPRERRSEAVFLTHDIVSNVVLPHLRFLSRFGLGLNRRAERAKVTDLAARVRLKAAGLKQKVWRLSGGNQQKVVFARAVAASPRILLLDEPTRGVDVGAKFDIYALLRDLAASGAAIALASSQLDELIELSSRIAILRGGRIAEVVSSQGLTEARLLELCYGDAAR